MPERLGNAFSGLSEWWQWTALAVLVVSVGLVLYTYFIYPALLLLMNRLKRHEPISDLSDGDLPEVCMVVAAHNEAKVIADKVGNFLEIDYPAEKLSLVIGSDGSDDGTADIAREAAGGDGRVTVRQFDENRGKVNVLNDLMESTETPIVIMSDANTIYEPGSVRRLVRHFPNEKVGGVCGKLLLTVEGGDASREEGLYWRYETHLKRLESGVGSISSINGQIFAFRRDLYESLPADAITEDQHLGLQILAKGRRILFEPEAVAREPVGSMETERARRLRISTGNFQTLFRAGLAMLNPLAGFPAMAYVSHKVIRWTVPLLMATALVSNGLLWRIEAGMWLLICQGAFYGIALLPAAVPPLRAIAPLRLAHYFVSMNLTIARGFFMYLRRPQRAAWNRTGR